MASAKLTTSVRDTITNRILKYRFGGEIQQHLANRREFADAVYDAIYDEPTRKRMNDLPKGWLPSDYNVRVQFAATVDGVYFNGEDIGTLYRYVDEQRENRHRTLLSKHCRGNGIVAVFDAGHELCDRHTALERENEDLTKRISEAQSHIRSVVNSVTTTNRLREVWPESAAFLEGFDDVKLSLPAVPVKELNALLDLPVE